MYRCYYLARSADDWKRAIVSVLADRGVGFGTMCGIALVAWLAFGEVRVPSWMGWALGGVLAAGLIVLAAAWAARGRLASVRQSMPLVAELFRRPGVLMWVAVLSILLQTLVVIVNIFNGLALHLEIPIAFYFLLIPLVAVATMIPVSLNGLGVREGAFVFFLAQVGVPEAQALSLALLWLAILIASSLIGGLVWIVTPAPPRSDPAASPA